MNPNPDYFWTRYLEMYFNGEITQRYGYPIQRSLSGFTIDLDLMIPCDSNKDPLDIQEDYRLAKVVAEEFKE